jgi:putative nucleotidyltransferase with HDIG domain
MQTIGLEELLRKARDLAPLPPSATKLAALVSAREVEIKELVGVVELDPALTARLLRVANSAASAARMPIRSARDAIVRLGNATVLALAVARAVRQQLNQALPLYVLGEDQLWRHSVACALAAEVIAPRCKPSPAPETFAAALLHDLGKLLLSRFLPEDQARLFWRARARPLSGIEAELEVVGIDHAHLGGLIAQHWGLPPRIALAIERHHAPEKASDPTCDVVAVADQLAKGLKAAAMPDDLVPGDASGSCARLGLDEAFLTESKDKLKERFGLVLAQFS